MSFFTKYNTYRIILKSGASFEIRAKDAKVTYKVNSLEVTGYEFSDLFGARPLFIKADEIVALIKL